MEHFEYRTSELDLFIFRTVYPVCIAVSICAICSTFSQQLQYNSTSLFCEKYCKQRNAFTVDLNPLKKCWAPWDFKDVTSQCVLLVFHFTPPVALLLLERHVSALIGPVML